VGLNNATVQLWDSQSLRLVWEFDNIRSLVLILNTFLHVLVV
jgi:hypothetical protein